MKIQQPTGKSTCQLFPWWSWKNWWCFTHSLKQKLLTPWLVGIWKGGIISVFLMIMKDTSAWLQRSRFYFFFFNVYIYCILISPNDSYDWEPWLWTRGTTAHWETNGRRFHLPQQNRGVNGRLTNSLFKFPEPGSSLTLHSVSAVSWGLSWRELVIFPSINNN